MASSPLDDLCRSLATTDTKKKLSVGADLIAHLNEAEEIQCEDLGALVDGLVPWMQSSNFKVSQNGLETIGLLISHLQSGFRPYINTIIGAVIDRLGDSRETVREKAREVVHALMDAVVEPQTLFEGKLMTAFTHKNGKVREESLELVQTVLNSHGAGSLTVSRLLGAIVGLLSDPTANVRDAAMATLVEIYRHVGERVRIDLHKKYQVPPQKLNMLGSRFDELRNSGDMMPTATLAIGTTQVDGDDDRHSSKSSGGSSAKSRSSSVPAGARRVPGGGFTLPRPAADGRSSVASTTSSASVRRNPSMRVAGSGGNAGAVDEESFMSAFEDVKRVTIFSGRSLTDELNKARETLSKSANDWKVRVDALTAIRALFVAGAADYHDEIAAALRTLDVPFQVSVKDLRSQVVREACITIAYMAQRLSHRLDRFLESLLQSIINLIPNSAKVMSSSGIVCIRFLIRYTSSPRFIPILTSNVTSKSKEIRRHCCEFLDQLLHTWPTHTLEKHVGLIQECIKKGIADADPEARQFARKAFWGFADHFRDQADHLLNNLEHHHRKLLHNAAAPGQHGGGGASAGDCLSNSSSSNSLHTAGRVVSSGYGQQSTMPRSRQSSVANSRENLLERRNSNTLSRKGSSGIPLYQSPLKSDGADHMTRSMSGGVLSPPPAASSAVNNSLPPRAHAPPSGRATPVRSMSGLSGRQITSYQESRRQQGRKLTAMGSETSPLPNGSSPYGGRYGIGAAGATTGAGFGSPSASAGSPAPMRSNSAIDASAVRRANVRAQYAQRSRIVAQNSPAVRSRKSSISDPNQCKTPEPGATPSGGPQHLSRNGRSRSKIGMVHSQPGSRSTSPTSLRLYHTYYDSPQAGGGTGTVGRRRSSGIPRSTASSRDPSPSRGGGGAITPSGLKYRAGPSSGRTVGGGAHAQTPKRPLMTESILRQSREAETALADALKHSPSRKPSNGGAHPQGQHHQHHPFDDGSDESEASSISSVGLGHHHQHHHSSSNNGNHGNGVGGSSRPMQQRFIQSPPNATSSSRGFQPRSLIDPVDDSENLNPEDVHKSLRSTASAIQNYSFDHGTRGAAAGGVSKGASLDLTDAAPPTLEEKMSLLDLSGGGAAAARRPSPGRSNGSQAKDEGDQVQIQEIMEILSSVKTKSRSSERRTCMTSLIRMTREGKTAVIQEHFKSILRLLLENLSDDVGAARALVFGVLTEMLRQESLIASFQAFTELIILKVLEAHRDEEKDVERAAEACAAAMAGVLPPDVVIRVLNPIIKTGDFPVNQAAVKMLTKLADHEPAQDVIVQQLPEIMPGLLKAYDNVESSVRKASVFCMVSLHQRVGEELQPHLETLNGSKLKLLNLYIKRAQAQKEQSAPVSPRQLATPL